jgi:hypothetical protein
MGGAGVRGAHVYPGDAGLRGGQPRPRRYPTSKVLGSPNW